MGELVIKDLPLKAAGEFEAIVTFKIDADERNLQVIGPTMLPDLSMVHAEYANWVMLSNVEKQKQIPNEEERIRKNNRIYKFHKIFVNIVELRSKMDVNGNIHIFGRTLTHVRCLFVF